MSMASGESLPSDASALLARMLKKPLYLMIRTFTVPERVPELLAEHLTYMLKLEAEGVLFASGPTHDASEQPTGSVTVLRADSFGAARALAELDPFVREGILTYSLHRWTLMEGSLQVRVSLGTGRFDLP